ncbi:MAG: hypothetical protein FWG97_02440 [Deltaproteobacteria bacterium]|nr:hypothetical protein [Deltaproteobacteria bacterium]
MKKIDLTALAIFAAATFLLVWPESAGPMEWLTRHQRYRLGFLVFAILGPLGEAAAARLGGRPWPRPALLAASSLMWGLYGLGAALIFWLFSGGVALAQGAGLLPGGSLRLGTHFLKAFFGSSFFTEPFFTSLLVSFCFTAPFLAARRLGGAALSLWAEGQRPDLRLASEAADWPAFIRSEAVALPLFRVPCQTFIFMLPPSLWLPATAWLFVLLAALSPKRP